MIIPYPDIVPGCSEGVPGNVQPTTASQHLVGIFTLLEELHQSPELRRILGVDIGSLTKLVLRIIHTTHLEVDCLVAESGINDNRPHDLPGRLQQQMTAVGHIRHILQRRDVLRVLLEIHELL